MWSQVGSKLPRQTWELLFDGVYDERGLADMWKSKISIILVLLLAFCENALAYNYDLFLLGQDEDHTMLGVCTSDTHYPDSFLNPYGKCGNK